MRLGRVGSVDDPVVERIEPVHARVLLEQHDVGPRDDRALAFIGVDQPGEALEQGRLAGAVAANEREPVAFANVEVELADKPAFTLDEAEVFVREDWAGMVGQVAICCPAATAVT